MNRLRAAWNRLVALWHRRWERPEPRHTARPAEPPQSPRASLRDRYRQLTNGLPAAGARPYVDPDDGPKHRQPR